MPTHEVGGSQELVSVDRCIDAVIKTAVEFAQEKTGEYPTYGGVNNDVLDPRGKIFDTSHAVENAVRKGYINTPEEAADLTYALLSSGLDPKSTLRYLKKNKGKISNLGRTLSPSELAGAIGIIEDLSAHFPGVSIATIARVADALDIRLDEEMISEESLSLLAANIDYKSKNKIKKRTIRFGAVIGYYSVTATIEVATSKPHETVLAGGLPSLDGDYGFDDEELSRPDYNDEVFDESTQTHR